MTKHRFFYAVILLLALSLSCNFFSNLSGDGKATPVSVIAEPTQVSAQAPASQQTESPAASQETAQPPAQKSAIKNLIQQTLALRSVKIKLTSKADKGGLMQTIVDVDADGNLHIVQNYCQAQKSLVPADAADLIKMEEIFVVDGKIYAPTGDESKMGALDEGEPGEQLALTLGGMNGPFLWLKALPKGSFSVQGDSRVGDSWGKKYAVKANLDGAQITGSVVVDAESGALTLADLNIPAALTGKTGALVIHFEVIKTPVEKIVAPVSN